MSCPSFLEKEVSCQYHVVSVCIILRLKKENEGEFESVQPTTRTLFPISQFVLKLSNFVAL